MHSNFSRIQNSKKKFQILAAVASKLHRFTTTTDYHIHQSQTHFALKRNKKHLVRQLRYLRRKEYFSSDGNHGTSRSNVNNSGARALRLPPKKTGQMDQEKIVQFCFRVGQLDQRRTRVFYLAEILSKHVLRNIIA